MKDEYEPLRNALIQRRADLGDSQVKVAGRMKRDPAGISGLERGYPRTPQLHTLREWVRGLYGDVRFTAHVDFDHGGSYTFDITPEIEK